jgi:amidase
LLICASVCCAPITHGAGEHPHIESAFTKTIDVLRDLAADVVDPIEFQADTPFEDAELQVLMTEFKVSVNDYLGSHAVGEDRDTPAGLIIFNEQYRDRVMPIFGQEIFTAAITTQGLDEPAYLQALAASNARLRQALAVVFATARHLARLRAIRQPNTAAARWYCATA